jgi:serine/threonine-protein kinase
VKLVPEESESNSVVETTLSFIVADDQRLLSTVDFERSQGKDTAVITSGLVLNSRYELERPLGRGGMGCVFLAKDRRLDRPVAVKIIRPDHWELVSAESRAAMNAAFEEEARLGASLLHPAIATIYDYGFHAHSPFAVFEFVPGTSLREMIKSRAPLPLEDVQDIVGRLAGALDYAHQKGIVHRDLKPENICFDEHGQCKILDLGLAKRFRHDVDWHFAGTPAYASPEQSSEKPSDGRTDQCALAIIAYELLTGHRVFKAGDWQSMLAMHRDRIPASLKTHIPSIPPTVDSAIARALRKDPNERFSTCMDFALALGCHIASLPQLQKQTLQQAIVKQVSGTWRDSFRLVRARRVCLALQPDRFWILTDDRIESWPTNCLRSIGRKGRLLTIAVATPNPHSTRRYKFRRSQDCLAWFDVLAPLVSDAPVRAEPSEHEMPVLLKSRPNVRMQLFGACEATARNRADAELLLRLQAVIQNANVVVDVAQEKVVHLQAQRLCGTNARF